MMTDSLLLGDNRAMRVLRLKCPFLAAWRGPIVVVGRTGAGKGVLVDEIRRYHAAGTPFARIAATASRHSLLYSTLFGFMKGTFTGAARDTRGLVASLSGGVLFLDDFQDLGDELQHYLVDIADGKPFWPLGAERPVTPNVRIIVGTQLPLDELTRRRDGALREDLFERLNGVAVTIPPLADRLDDIPILARGWLLRLAAREQRPVAALTDAAVALLRQYHWPRNVRELERTLERAAFLAYCESVDGPVIDVRHFECEPFYRRAGRNRGRPVAMPSSLVLAKVNVLGSVKAAADATGLTVRTVQRAIQRARTG